MTPSRDDSFFLGGSIDCSGNEQAQRNLRERKASSRGKLVSFSSCLGEGSDVQNSELAGYDLSE